MQSKGRATSLVFRQARHRNNDVHKEILSASDELGDENLDLPFVCFGNIVSATNNFSEDNMLGQGGFGKVYKVTSKKILQIKDCISSFGIGLFNLILQNHAGNDGRQQRSCNQKAW